MLLLSRLFISVLSVISLCLTCCVVPLKAETAPYGDAPSVGVEGAGDVSQGKKRTRKNQAVTGDSGQEGIPDAQPETTPVKKRTSRNKPDLPSSDAEPGTSGETGDTAAGRNSESGSRSSGQSKKSEPKPGSEIASRSRKSVLTGEKSYKLKNVQVVVKTYKEKDRDKERSTVRLTSSGATKYSCESRTLVPEAVIETDSPRTGYDSMLVEVYSGGAHCCYTTIVCIVHGSKAGATAFDRQDGGTFGFTDVDGDGVKEIQINDWSFAYYGTNDSDLELSFAFSPAMARLMVYEGDKWRADRPGEFTNFYAERKARCEKDARIAAEKAKQQGYYHRTRGEIENNVSVAIEAAYYMHMSGGAEAEIRDLLQGLLPPAWQSQSRKIASDIRRYSKDFNPARRIF